MAITEAGGELGMQAAHSSTFRCGANTLVLSAQSLHHARQT
jgi:hypothetical protein